MKQAIDELKAIPGVVGACLFGAQEGLLQSNLPGIFKPEKLSAVGKQLTKLLVAGRMSFSDLNDLSLHYDESAVIARELRKGLTIFVICDPSFNHNLLTMSLNLLQEEMNEQGGGGTLLEATVPADDAGGAAQVGPDLDPLLDEIKGLLSKVLGPMASIIFDEILQEWSLKGATVDRLGALMEMLHQEIGDPEKIVAFKALTAPLFKS
ncbi:hypothetical protein [Geopsychrobacter electrodiphilus]|uniref:hypothetical protein n=1 Tax=Geopsychrobacter electrodiphilus TaxID=225196 RepID=UPI000360007C|nr:hypothetical protein [Geopsychrobacter electrodiphilus]